MFIPLNANLFCHSYWSYYIKSELYKVMRFFGICDIYEQERGEFVIFSNKLSENYFIEEEEKGMTLSCVVVCKKIEEDKNTQTTLKRV